MWGLGQEVLGMGMGAVMVVRVGGETRCAGEVVSGGVEEGFPNAVAAAAERFSGSGSFVRRSGFGIMGGWPNLGSRGILLGAILPDFMESRRCLESMGKGGCFEPSSKSRIRVAVVVMVEDMAVFAIVFMRREKS
jgi:hypothetical protein